MTCYKAARIAAGIPSQRQGAIRLGFDLPQYRKWEEGIHAPSVRVVALMAEKFGLTAGQVLGLEPLPEPPVNAAPLAS